MRIGIRGLVLAFTLSCGKPVVSGDWNSFRGPAGNGISDETNIPVQWDGNTNVKWKVPLPQPANGSPIVSNGRVFLTCAQDDEGKRRSLYSFDRRDGKQKWVRTVQLDEVMPTHKTNPYCGTTPAADGQRVIVWHGSAGLHCYDHEGNELWARQLGQFRHMWGYGTSPVIYRDRVILYSGPGETIFVAAFALSDGETIWKTEEPQLGNGERNDDGKYMGSWTTPVIASVNGSDQVICILSTRVIGYDPKDGEIIWTCDGIRGERGDLAYSSPMIAGDICVAIGGFRGPGIGLRLGGTGNVTATDRLWRNENNPQNIGSGVFLDGSIYRANAGPGTIDCLDPLTGEIRWRDRAAGANHWGSIVSADGHLYATNQEGTTVVFKPNPAKFEQVAVNRLGEPSNSTPAISEGELFIRTFQHLYCIGQ